MCMQTDKSTQTNYLIMSINHSNVKGHLGASVLKKPRSNHDFDFFSCWIPVFLSNFPGVEHMYHFENQVSVFSHSIF